MTNLANLTLTIFLVFVGTKVCFSQEGGEVIFYSTVVEIDKNKRTENVEVILQINRKTHDWMSYAKIYVDGQSKFHLSSAVIKDKNGLTVRRLKSKDILESSVISDGSFHSDTKKVEFSLSWHEYPYRIHLEYSTEADEFLQVVNWRPYYFVNIPVRRSLLQVRMPEDYKCQISVSDTLLKYSRVPGDVITHEWEIRNFKSKSTQLGSASTSELNPAVNIVPSNFYYKVEGNQATWVEFGNWINKLNEGKLELTPLVKSQVNDLILNSNDQYEIIEKLYRHLQENTRYINVSIDHGGLEPYPASFVCEKQYGDCKALTIYMKALLEYAGIKSFYTLVKADENNGRINNGMPWQQFNHVILAVPMDKEDTVWLENTAEYHPPNYLGTFTQGRKGLLVNHGKSRLVDIPALTKEDVVELRKIDISMDENDLIIKHKNILRGPKFESYINIKNVFTPNEIVTAFSRSIGLDESKVDKFNIAQKDKNVPQIEVDMHLRSQDLLREFGSMTVLKIPPLFIDDYEEASVRDTDLFINYPVVIHQDININYPLEKSNHLILPDTVAFESRFGRYQQKVRKEGDVIKVQRIFELEAGYIKLTDYEEFIEFINHSRSALEEAKLVIK